MSMVPDFCNEKQLREKICNLKDQLNYKGLVSFLITAITSCSMPSKIQARAYNELGLAHLQMDDPVEAEKAFILAIECAPWSVNPRFNLANLALYSQKYEHGLKMFLEILETEPDHAAAQHHAGLCYAMTDRYRDALRYFEGSAAASPEAMGPNFWAGECHLRFENFNLALPYFKQALKITPDHTESHRGLAICLYHEKDFQQCISLCDTLISSGGGAEYLALRIKGDALLEIGKGVMAAHCHLALTDLDFDAREFLSKRARELAEQGNDLVKEYITTIVENLPEMKLAFSGILPEVEPNI